MSAIVKTLVMLVGWLIFFLLTFQFCVRPCCLPGDRGETVIVDEPGDSTIAEAVRYPIETRIGSPTVQTGEGYPQLRTDLLAHAGANPDELLEITGYYYPGEAAPDGFANMGLARAARIRDLVVPPLDADRIELRSRLIDNAELAAQATAEAGSFRWIEAAPEEGTDRTEIVELDRDEIIIRFPFNAANKDLEAEVEDYLKKLAERMTQTDERVTITGHTDNIGGDASNVRLGQQRADFVRAALVRNGAANDRITTDSRGESQPTASNETDSGRAANRRVLVKLLPN